MKKNRNIFPCFIIITIVLLILFCLYFYSNQKSIYKVETKYFEGEVFSANEAANMLDAFSENNVLISPLNINSSLANLYMFADNNTKKNLKRHFKQEPEKIISSVNNKIKALNNSELKNENYYAFYNQLITEFFNNNYDKLTINNLKNLNLENKSKIITIAKKLDLLYLKLYEQEEIDLERIKKYKATEEDLKITNTNLLLMLSNITQNHQLFIIKPEVKNYHKLYLNNLNISKEIQLPNNINISNIDFTKVEELTKTINKDIKDFTNNKLTYYVSENALHDNEALYINSFYFNYSWQNNYTKNALKDNSFYSFSGTESIVRYMYSKETVYLENEYAKGFIKDFYTQNYSFVGILPKKKDDFKVSNLNLNSLLASAKNNIDCLVAIPEFSLTYEADLTLLLNNLKMAEFISSKANYSKLTKELTSLAYYRQKVNLIISTTGTISNHSTENSLKTFTIDSSNKEVILNRPFAFLIINNETKDIIFIGKIQEI